MNVIQNENLFRAPGERNKRRSQRQLAAPSLMNRYQLESVRLEGRNVRQSKWKSTNSKKSNYRSGNRERIISSSSLLLSHSRNNTFRGGTKTTTGGGIGNSSAAETGGIILSLTSGRGEAKAEVGIAALDLRCPYLILCQISDSQTYANTLSKLYVFDPIEVLMPDTMCERAANKSVLYCSILEKFPDVQVTPISRIHFNDASGLERIKTLCAGEYSSVELFVKQKYYALAAAAAVLKYIEYVQRIVYTPKSMKIEFQGSPNTTTIDLESARSLELVQSQCGQRNISLLGILDHCLTPMGRKLLRANILQPPFKQHTILARQASVAELVSNRSLRALIQPILRRLYGADRLLALSTAPVLSENSLQCAEQNLNYVLLLKNLLEVIPELEAILSASESELLRTIRKRLANSQFQLMKEKILEMIHPDARSVTGYTSSNMQRCFAIKAGVNDLLDIARQTYCELIDDMKIMVENLASKYKLTLSLGCNASMGYHVQAIFSRNSNAETFDPPNEFIEVRKNKRIYTMTTTALTTLSQQCVIACEELHLMSNVLLCDLLQNIREYIGCLFQLSVDVAELDLISSLAQVSSLETYVRPMFDTKLELLDSRHPVMDVYGLDNPVPNNVNASIPRNFYVLTGPNMSGKSTYLKQIVLLHIMAQLGCFVPAKKATFRITDLIFCKITVRDDIECNASTFTLEMRESQYILRSVTPTSLIVLDELCKGTAIEEGASIAWAICERLLNTTAFVFATTHFSYLTKLSDLYYNVTNLHFETISVQDAETDNFCQLTHTHQLKTGVAPTDDYGIVLAEFSGLPKPVTDKARNYASNRLALVDRASTSKDYRNQVEQQTCYDSVVAIYELLEEDEYDQERLIDLMKRIVTLQTQNHTKNNVQENYDRIETKEINLERVNERKGSICLTSQTPRSKTNLNLSKQRTPPGTMSCRDSREISISTSSVPTRSVSTHTSPKRNSESFNLQNDPQKNMYYAPFRCKSSSTDSLLPCSIENENISNKFERQSLEFDRSGCSMSSSITSSALSFPISHYEASPVQLSMTMNSSLPKIYEYCLSDDDFEPFVTSGTSNVIDEANQSRSMSPKNDE